METLINKRKVKELVIGMSLDNEGKPNDVHKLVEEFMMDITLWLVFRSIWSQNNIPPSRLHGYKVAISRQMPPQPLLILDSFITRNKQ